MASILPFGRRAAAAPLADDPLGALLDGFSIEVMPRTAAKVEDFRALLPAGTRVYVAEIDGTPFADMLATVRRLAGEGMVPVPHVPARGLASEAALEARIAAYAGAGVREALVIAGGIARPRGPFAAAIEVLRTGVFDRAGFTRLDLAGHPEGNRDIDPEGGEARAMAALLEKQAFGAETDATLALVTQFVFDAAPVVDWAGRLAAAGVRLPVHVGLAGPAKLQTLIKYAMTCGVGPSARVLQRRAADLSRLVLPFEPTEVLTGLARAKAADPALPIAGVHFFPLGGILATTDYVRGLRAGRTRRASA